MHPSAIPCCTWQRATVLALLACLGMASSVSAARLRTTAPLRGHAAPRHLPSPVHRSILQANQAYTYAASQGDAWAQAAVIAQSQIGGAQAGSGDQQSNWQSSFQPQQATSGNPNNYGNYQERKPSRNSGTTGGSWGAFGSAPAIGNSEWFGGPAASSGDYGRSQSTPTSSGSSGSQDPAVPSSSNSGASQPTPPSSGSSGTSSLGAVLQGVLDQHNMYRARHQVSPLSWDSSIQSTAQAYADRCIFQHSGAPGLGENLAKGYGSFKDGVDAWYNEVSSYSYGSDFSEATGHFTQMVWKSSSRLGCGFNTGCAMYVCNYAPAGNVIGQFAQNVLPPTS